MESSGHPTHARARDRAKLKKEKNREQTAASRAAPKKSRRLAPTASGLMQVQVSRRNAVALRPAGWLPQPWEPGRYIYGVLAAAADADGIARFLPSDDAALSVGWSRAAYSIVRLAHSESERLINTVAPGLLEKLQLRVSGRDVKAGEELLHVGAEIILFRSMARSGAHYDATPSVLVPIVGERTVWLAPRETFSEAPRGRADSVLHPTLDPAEGGSESGWMRVCAQPGRVVYLPRGEWHSVQSNAGSIAISLSVSMNESGSGDGGIPRGFVDGVAPTRPVAGGWASPDALVRMWYRRKWL